MLLADIAAKVCIGIDIANGLSDENDWEEAEYQLYLRHKIETAENDIRQGRVYSNEEARAYLKRCRQAPLDDPRS